MAIMEFIPAVSRSEAHGDHDTTPPTDHNFHTTFFKKTKREYNREVTYVGHIPFPLQDHTRNFDWPATVGWGE
jgi:hypothetical protein